MDATAKIIARDQNLDSAYLDALELYMGVTIEPYGTSLYMISSMVTTSKAVTSYLTGSATTGTVYDELFSFTGLEPEFVLSPLITPTTLLASYLPDFIESNFPSITPQTEFTTFDSIVNYVKLLAADTLNPSFISKTPFFIQSQVNPYVTSHLYINGSVTLPKNKNLTVADGYLLVIDGNLSTNENSTITGNIVVNGTLNVIGKGNSIESLKGTLYVDGNVTTGKSIYLGTHVRPTFIFSEGDITFGNNVSGVGYFLSDNFTANQGNVSITGGVYVTINASLPSGGIIPQTDLNETLFYDYAIPILIVVAGEEPIPGGSNFIFTFPKLI